jgi:hypothetical protein
MYLTRGTTTSAYVTRSQSRPGICDVLIVNSFQDTADGQQSDAFATLHKLL